MGRGKFVVVDGLDGSGKGTQAKLLLDRLRNEGYQVELADFPRYGKWSAQFVERYLRGEFGTAKEVGAKRASLFYALDRYAASFQIEEWLRRGRIVISNRYVSASKGHQLGKITDPDLMTDFLGWVNELEYEILRIPKPDLTLFLHMSPEIGQNLVDKKEAREYTQGEKRDIHEADVGHLQDAERAFLHCLQHDTTENWEHITCFTNDQPKSIDEIHREIYERIKKIL
jgi:dTMP kinase